MARPRKEGLTYFPHDCDAASDEKIEALRAVFGNDGYAFYFILLERIYRTPESELDISEESTRRILSKKIGISVKKFHEMLEYSVKLGCFSEQKFQDKILSSNGILRRAEIVEKHRNRERTRYSKKTPEFSPVSEGVSAGVSASKTMAEMPQSKVNKSKVNKSKIKESIREEQNAPAPDEEISDCTVIDITESAQESEVKTEPRYRPLEGYVAQSNKHPTIDEVLDFCRLAQYEADVGRRFWNYYESQGWVTQSGIPITKWRPKLNEWMLKQSQFERNGNGSNRKNTDRGKGAWDDDKFNRELATCAGEEIG